MKKSEIYRLAQIAVQEHNCLYTRYKLEIIRELMKQEDLALFCEKQEEEKVEEA